MAQIDHLTNSLARAELEGSKLATDLEAERSTGRRRHIILVDELTKSLSTADTLASLIRRIGTTENSNSEKVTVSHALKV